MSALGEMLDGAVEVDALAFSGAGYADARLGLVRGRVKRRRAARSAGVGGVSVLSVGALAVGLPQLPFVSLGAAGPGTGSGVFCTTATPAVDSGVVAVVPDGAKYAVADTSTGATFFIGWVGGDSRVWNVDASEAPLSLLHGTPTFVLPSGITLALDPEDGPPLASDTALVTVMPIETYAQQIGLGSLYDVEIGAVPGSGSSWDLKLNGSSIGTFTSDEFNATFTFENGESARFDLAEPGLVTLTLPGGENLVFRRVDGQPVYVGQATAPPVANSGPDVTCVTSSPEPSASAIPSLSATSTADPTPGSVASPFACGYVFDEPMHNSDGIAVTAARWLSATDAIAALHEEYGGKLPSNVPTPTSGTLAIGIDVSATAPDGRDIQDAGGGVDFIDPAGYLEKYGLPGRAFMAGTTIVGVKDGRVVATVPTDRDKSLLLWSNVVPDADLYLTVIDADEALAPCGDTATWTDIYVVTGIGLISGNAWLVDPIYAWEDLPEAP